MRTAACVLVLILASALPRAAAADEDTNATPQEAADAEAEAEANAERFDNRGHLGIGYQVSLGGARGLAVRYGAGPVVLSLIVGLRVISPDDQDEDTRFGVEAALGLAIPIQRWDGTHLGLGLRAAVGAQHVRNDDFEDGSGPYDDPYGFAFEMPIYAEVWLSQRIALIVETGVVLNVIGREGSPLVDRPAGIALGLGTAGLFSSAGLSFYF